MAISQVDNAPLVSPCVAGPGGSNPFPSFFCCCSKFLSSPIWEIDCESDAMRAESDGLQVQVTLSLWIWKMRWIKIGSPARSLFFERREVLRSVLGSLGG